MKFGAMQNVLGEPAPSVFQTASGLGFNGVELDWNDLAQARQGGSLGPDLRAELRAAADKNHVEIPSVCAGFLNCGGIASPDTDKQTFGVEAIREGLRLCHDLGARVLLVPFFGTGEIADREGIARVKSHLKELASEAEAAAVTLAIEHTLPANEAVEILVAVDSPRVGDYWDMANCLCFGYDPIHEVTTLGKYITQVHAKEFHQGNGKKGSQKSPRYDGLNTKPFGQGQVPVRDVLSALRRIGYDGYVVMETGAFGDKKQSARAALDVLHAAT